MLETFAREKITFFLEKFSFFFFPMSIVVHNQPESVQEAVELDLVRILAPDESTPQDIIDLAEKCRVDLIPTTSKKVYDQVYNAYLRFLANFGLQNHVSSKNALLVYTNELLKSQAPTTVITKMSMIKSQIIAKTGVDVFAQYPVLLELMKKKLDNHSKKKAPVFEQSNIDRYFDLPENNPSVWENFKVVREKFMALISIYGGLRGSLIISILKIR